MALLAILCLFAVLKYSIAAFPVDIRLVNSDADHQGIVEVLVNRKWGRICGDDFEEKNAHVICRTLGYPSALFSHDNIYYGQGRRGKVWKLNCTGEEDKILDCDVVRSDHCSDQQRHVGVKCQLSPPVRLTCPYNQTCNNNARKRGPDPGECTPSVHVEGIVEVYYNERWWPVSADEWDDEDVNVVCGQLGYPVSFGTVTRLTDISSRVVSRRQKNQFKKTHLKNVILQGLSCTGTERGLSLCPHHGWGPFDNPGGETATARCGFHPHSTCLGENHQVSIKLALLEYGSPIK